MKKYLLLVDNRIADCFEDRKEAERIYKILLKYHPESVNLIEIEDNREEQVKHCVKFKR